MSFDYLNFDLLVDIGKQPFKKYPYTEYTNELRIDDEIYALVGYISEVKDLNNNMVLSLSKLKEFLEGFVEQFGDRLGDKVKELLREWQESGLLNIIINEALQLGIERLEQRTSGFLHLQNYPRLENEINDNGRIKRILADATKEMREVVFTGQLEITEPIVLNKNFVQLKAVKGTKITAIEAMESMLEIVPKTNEITSKVLVSSIELDGNQLARFGVYQHKGYGLYTSLIHYEDVVVHDCSLDGFHLNAPAWLVFLRNCTSEFNGRDGVRSVIQGTEQINHVQFNDCFIQSNKENGITLNGADYLINGCVLERNQNNIAVDSSLDNNNRQYANKITIANSYFEKGKNAQILLKTSSILMGASLNSINISDCLITGDSDPTSTGTSLIKCEGGTNITLKTSNNIYSLIGKVVNPIDGGGLLTKESVINDTPKVINPNYAKIVQSTGNKTIAVTPTSVSNLDYSAVNLVFISSNIYGRVDDRITFILDKDLYNFVPFTMGVYITTDVTSAKINFDVAVFNLETNTTGQSTSVPVEITKSGNYKLNLENFWGTVRLANNEVLVGRFILNADVKGGENIQLGVPYFQFRNN